MILISIREKHTPTIFLDFIYSVKKMFVFPVVQLLFPVRSESVHKSLTFLSDNFQN